MNTIERQVRRAAEQSLGNEALTADLDDDGAAALNEWAMAALQAMAVTTTAEPPPPERVRALQRLMLRVSGWLGERPGRQPVRDRLQLAAILDRAVTVYGPTYHPPARARREAWLAAEVGQDDNRTQAEFVRSLRRLVEVGRRDGEAADERRRRKDSTDG